MNSLVSGKPLELAKAGNSSSTTGSNNPEQCKAVIVYIRIIKS